MTVPALAAVRFGYISRAWVGVGTGMKPLAADDPRTIGEYRLQGRLGEGGMGRVYLGLSPGGRAVAIKIVHPQLAGDAEFLRRFQREVESARAVSGIYTAPVVATGLDQRPPWLATAFVPGPSLDQMVADHGPLPVQALWPLAGGLVEALQAIHTCGVVHRDLKPANVLLAADGPRLIDFGISRAADGTVLTAAGVVFGTPGYMSPEQAQGNPVGPPADVFAFGCVIAFAASGTALFGDGSAATVLYRVVHDTPALDGVPSRLRELVAGCLAKDPAARPAPRALAAAIAREVPQGSSSAVSFWPRSVASLISGYRADAEGATQRLTVPADAQRSAQPPATAAMPQAYPSPRGYGAAQSPQVQPPQVQQPQVQPSGYPPAPAGPVGYAPRYQNPYAPPPWQVSRAPRPPVPSSVRDAVQLMRVGAAYAIFQLGVAVLTIHHVVATLNGASSTAQSYDTTVQTDRNLGGVLIGICLAYLVEAALWLWMAKASNDGKSWARVTGTVFFGLFTIGNFAQLSSPGATGLMKLLAIAGWVIACVTVVLLWQPRSSSFFRGR